MTQEQIGTLRVSAWPTGLEYAFDADEDMLTRLTAGSYRVSVIAAPAPMLAAEALRADLRALGYSDTAINAMGASTTMMQRAIDARKVLMAAEPAPTEAKALSYEQISAAGLGLEYVHSVLCWAACGYVHTPERIAQLHTSFRIVDRLVNAALAASPAPTWGYAKTVGNAVAQLQTFDPAIPIYGALHLNDGRCIARGLTFSRERVVGERWIDSSNKEVPYSIVAWSNPKDPADLIASPTPSDVGPWRVGEFISSANRPAHVLMLAVGAKQIAEYGAHPDFVRWVSA